MSTIHRSTETEHGELRWQAGDVRFEKTGDETHQACFRARQSIGNLQRLPREEDALLDERKVFVNAAEPQCSPERGIVHEARNRADERIALPAACARHHCIGTARKCGTAARASERSPFVEHHGNACSEVSVIFEMGARFWGGSS